MEALLFCSVFPPGRLVAVAAADQAGPSITLLPNFRFSDPVSQSASDLPRSYPRSTGRTLVSLSRFCLAPRTVLWGKKARAGDQKSCGA